ncbi:Homoserine O-succinyltransferase [Novosphingobium sp. MBES04]|nr:Homoserine O-succinyltransferase [Novosphingobium sp. MBES04]
MPIKIPDDLPARQTLEAEGVTVMGEADAVRQDIRPLQIGLLNLMPDKVRTETQLARLLGATPLQIELTLVRMTDHVSRNTAQDHMEAFYRPWEDVREERFDGFIITGAPVERMPYEEVNYWEELRQILAWTQTNVHRTLTICWAAQAALYHFHGIPKRVLDAKAYGLYPHEVHAPASPFLRGFADVFNVPVSRWTEVCPDALDAAERLEVLASNPVTVRALSMTPPTACSTCSTIWNTTPRRSPTSFSATAARSCRTATSRRTTRAAARSIHGGLTATC